VAKKQVVLAYFADEAAADAAVESLKAWDEIDDQVKLNAIGVLVLDEAGKVKAQKLGRRTVGKGAGIGLLLALVTPLGLGAVIAGAGFGALHHKGLGLKSEDRERIAAELAGGKAAVGVLVEDFEAPSVTEKLGELGGTLETVQVTDEAIAEADASAPAVEAEEASEATQA
jgi:uncharacterized membrane protein